MSLLYFNVSCLPYGRNGWGPPFFKHFPPCPAHWVSTPQAAGLSLGTHMDICSLASTMLFLKCPSVANILKSPDFNLSLKIRRWNNTEYTFLWRQSEWQLSPSDSTRALRSPHSPQLWGSPSEPGAKVTRRDLGPQLLHSSQPRYQACDKSPSGDSNLSCISQMCEDQRQDQPSRVHQPPNREREKGSFKPLSLGIIMQWSDRQELKHKN